MRTSRLVPGRWGNTCRRTALRDRKQKTFYKRNPHVEESRSISYVATLSLTTPVLAKDLRTVGITVGGLGNPFFVQLAKGAEAKAQELGGGKVNATAVSADYDLNKQSTQIDNFIASGAEMVLIDAVDPNAIEPAINRLHDAGIVAVAVDESAKGADITIQTNNLEAGQKSCSIPPTSSAAREM